MANRDEADELFDELSAKAAPDDAEALFDELSAKQAGSSSRPTTLKIPEDKPRLTHKSLEEQRADERAQARLVEGGSLVGRDYAKKVAGEQTPLTGFVRGALAAVPFTAEVAGAVDSLASGKTAQEGIEDARLRRVVAARETPGSYAAGNLTTGATVFGKLGPKAAAAIGGLEGVLYSDNPVRDGAAGALVGYGLSKLPGGFKQEGQAVRSLASKFPRLNALGSAGTSAVPRIGETAATAAAQPTFLRKALETVEGGMPATAALAGLGTGTVAALSSDLPAGDRLAAGLSGVAAPLALAASGGDRLARRYDTRKANALRDAENRVRGDIDDFGRQMTQAERDANAAARRAASKDARLAGLQADEQLLLETQDYQQKKAAYDADVAARRQTGKDIQGEAQSLQAVSKEEARLRSQYDKQVEALRKQVNDLAAVTVDAEASARGELAQIYGEAHTRLLKLEESGQMLGKPPPADIYPLLTATHDSLVKNNPQALSSLREILAVGNAQWVKNRTAEILAKRNGNVQAAQAELDALTKAPPDFRANASQKVAAQKALTPQDRVAIEAHAKQMGIDISGLSDADLLAGRAGGSPGPAPVAPDRLPGQLAKNRTAQDLLTRPDAVAMTPLSDADRAAFQKEAFDQYLQNARENVRTELTNKGVSPGTDIGTQYLIEQALPTGGRASRMSLGGTVGGALGGVPGVVAGAVAGALAAGKQRESVLNRFLTTEKVAPEYPTAPSRMAFSNPGEAAVIYDDVQRLLTGKYRPSKATGDKVIGAANAASLATLLRQDPKFEEWVQKLAEEREEKNKKKTPGGAK